MGQMDIPLNEEGRAQALAMAEALEGDFDALYSSPLKRAYQTAEAISERFKKPIIVRDSLIERSFGSLSGKTWAEIETATHRDMKAVTKEEQYDYQPWGGESAEGVKARIHAFLDELKGEKHAKVVIVSHSGIISMMRHLYPNKETAHISNASVNEFEV